VFVVVSVGSAVWLPLFTALRKGLAAANRAEAHGRTKSVEMRRVALLITHIRETVQRRRTSGPSSSAGHASAPHAKRPPFSANG